MAEAGRHDEIQGEILHEYDGIEEADNQLPRWWVAVFLGTIAFGIAYWFGYEVYGAGKAPAERYAIRMAEIEALRAEAAAKAVVSEALLLSLSQNDKAVSAGKAIFDQNCVPCHEKQGQGKIGPNLTDNFWIHGGDPMTIYQTVQHGVPEKGMPPWEPVLGPDGTRQAVAYVLTLRGTNVPGKAPEGDPMPE